MKLITIQRILENYNPTQFLFDASGVLYNKTSTLVPGANDIIQAIRAKNIGICLLTNNSKHSPKHIQQWFMSHDLHFETNEIISSGLGLSWSKHIRGLLHNKNCFIQGASSSYPYVKMANPKNIVPSLEQADVIICTSFDSTDEKNHFKNIQKHLQKNPNIPVICCNPDHHIHNEDAITPVVGYWVHQLEKIIPTKAHWFGKPHSDMYHLVNDHLKTHFNRSIDSGTWFFDDNPENIQNFVDTYPNASGVFTHQTGLRYRDSLEVIQKQFPRVPYVTKSIGHT